MPDGHSGPFLVEGTRCIDQELPELRFGRPYDPFPVDVFLLGNMYKHYLLEVYNGIDWLWPLVAAMTVEEPSQRPTVLDARRAFENTCATVAPSRHHSRLTRKDEPIIGTVARQMSAAATDFFRVVRGWL
ncbi:hypothetical protein AURDEDRAFT_59531 [Auricularia subglabra TFB-10046 SS5]|nr:hypothetical protein AURDEDRAFT_59531 [Auricularia subglabra TFB-10046 SS5]